MADDGREEEEGSDCLREPGGSSSHLVHYTAQTLIGPPSRRDDMPPPSQTSVEKVVGFRCSGC